MKIIYTLALIAVISTAIFSCSKNDVIPYTPPSKTDTSTTLITTTTLVGNWNIVTDTVSYNGSNVMYHGTATDYYKFTKFGNLFINEGLDSYVDTALYGIETSTNRVDWLNNYISINGIVSRNQTVSPTYTITSVDTAKLILTSNISTSFGPRYEQIVFKKKK
ncbi:MAG TPA: hypothetical protein VK671_00520 [Mucilaginibacter sp.]|jgi:hypothetical protein|nr:hypothetical protein [Mucilaginibacter sp.]